ncbi:MAG: exodeoxyribonuclease III [Candidatus Izemoplasmatales bacterium]|nr:exodeoxyribonuclease III [Candidatus Izemoplasmatales bacterium]
MKIVSWNTNGLRACLNKGFMDFFTTVNADVFCIQETKMQPDQLNIEFPGYNIHFNSADKRGYSGTAVIYKGKPLMIIDGIDGNYNDEGRAITLEYEDFFLVTVYSPNSQEGLVRLPYRMEYEDLLRAYLTKLNQKKPVILCGDLNVAHQEIDIKNPKTNHFNAGFSDEERAKFTMLLSQGFTDTFRYLNSAKIKYSWWSYMFHARENNSGWRIDYFVVSDILKGRIKNADILTDIYGSDHCPIILDWE